ncbi:MAG TPA: chromosome segregation protein SMC [Solibacterales bacterium]|nr:chromosome segregation protein SMC [Bryobacterales bacterium]
MIVSRLAVRNWRNFRAVDVKLGERVFLVGPNASGKSNLLDVLRFLRDVAKPGGGLQSAMTLRGGLSKVRCLAARKEPDVEIELDLSRNGSGPEWRYAIGIRQQARGYRKPLLRFERVWRNGELVLERPDNNDKSDEERLTQTHLEQVNSNARFRDLPRFLESIRYLHLVPQLLRHPEAYQGPGVPDDPYGRNFLELVARTPDKTKKARLRRIEAALRAAVPQIRDLTDQKDESGVPHLEATWEHWRPNAGRQREDQFSDGTVRLIGLFWSLLDGDAPLLLEEPELSLNGAIVSKLPRLFHRLQRKNRRQIFVSTHSSDLLQDKGIDGSEIVMLRPDKEGSTALLASSVAEIRTLLQFGSSPGDVVMPRVQPPHLDQLALSLE